MRWLFLTGVILLLFSTMTLAAPVRYPVFSKHVTHKSTSVDPLEPFNRISYGFNHQLDRMILKPSAEIYINVIPGFIRTGVRHFFSNLGTIPTTINELLQLKLGQAGEDTVRLLFNSTIGVGGLFDVATPMGLPKHHEDFGLTLAHWGWQNSTYFVIPFLGPSTIRDGIGLVPNYFMSVWPYADHFLPAYVVYPAFALNVVGQRTDLLKADKVLAAASLDPYIVLRNAYLQKRAASMGNAALADRHFEAAGIKVGDDDLYVEDE